MPRIRVRDYAKSKKFSGQLESYLHIMTMSFLEMQREYDNRPDDDGVYEFLGTK